MQAEGFVKGRPIDLVVLDYGLFKVHSTGRIIGICGFLIRTDLGEAILIDTGFPEKYAIDTDAAVKEDRLYEFGEVLKCEPDNLPRAQLAMMRPNLPDEKKCSCSVGAVCDLCRASMVMYFDSACCCVQCLQVRLRKYAEQGKAVPSCVSAWVFDAAWMTMRASNVS